MAMNYLSSVPKLVGRENYEDWAFAVENILQLEGMAACIDGTETDSNKILKAKAKLVLTVDPSVYVHIKGAKTAQEVWNSLKKAFDNEGSTRKIGLLRSLVALKLDSCDGMENYVSQVIEKSQKLNKIGFAISDELTGSLLLAGLPKRFEPMLMAIEHSGTTISTDLVKSKLLDMQFDEPPREGAFVSRKFAGSVDNRRQRQNDKKPAESTNHKKTIMCFRCKQYGHYMNKCPKAAVNTTGSTEQKHAFSAVFTSNNFDTNDCGT